MEINGGNVVHEILGEAGELVVLTPGGRFSKDIEGLRPLAEELVRGGKRVLLWDRPNTGASDVRAPPLCRYPRDPGLHWAGPGGVNPEPRSRLPDQFEPPRRSAAGGDDSLPSHARPTGT